jgi:hypothetical protein
MRQDLYILKLKRLNRNRITEITNLTLVDKIHFASILKNKEFENINISEDKKKIHIIDGKYKWNDLNNENSKFLAWNIFHLIGTIFPITNLLGVPLFDNQFIYSLYGYFPYLTIPIVALSFLSLTASIFTFSFGGYNYLINNSDINSSYLFLSSVICLSISYLINFIFGITSAINLFSENIESYNDLKKMKYKILEMLILEKENDNIKIGIDLKL